MARPENFPEWASEDEIDPISGQNNAVEPPATRKQSGFTRREIPPRQWVNWLARRTWQWLVWCRDNIDSLTGRADTLEGRTITAGDGLTGGGDLSADRTVTMGTPSTITASSTNSTTGDSHTHAIDEATTSQEGIVRLNDTVTSTSSTQAATANAVKTAYDRASTQVGGGSISGVYYREAVVELGNSFDAGEEVIITRVGRCVTITSDGALNHSSASQLFSTPEAIPEWARPGHQVRNISVFEIDYICEVVVFDDGLFGLVYRKYDGTGVSKSTTGYSVTITYNV